MKTKTNERTAELPATRRYSVPELRSLLQTTTERTGCEDYAQFGRLLSEDVELLELASHAHTDALMPEFLLSMAYYLHIVHSDPDVQEFFDRLQEGEYDSQKYDQFRSHCLRHREELVELLSSRRVQTNNLVRCAVLLPALCHVGRAFRDRACALLDLGTSAGLHLLLDHYSYAYPELGGRVVTSKFESEVDLEVEFSWRGREPHDRETFFQRPEIARRIGIDLAPIDLAVPGQRQWLAAFNELDDAVVEAVLRLRQKVGLRLVAGDVIEKLEPLAAGVPRDELLVVIHSFMTVQFTDEARAALDAALNRIGAERDLAVISIENELTSSKPVELWVRTYRQGRVTNQCLARCQHPLDVGEWLEWLGPVG